MQKIETKAEVILFPCDLIPFEQICICYNKYNGISDTLLGAVLATKGVSITKITQRNKTHIFTWKLINK